MNLFRNKCAYNYSLEFEMAAVVFNLGALHSLMAVNQDRSIADGVQTAATNFQTAGTDSCFLYYRLLFLHTVYNMFSIHFWKIM